MVTDWQIQMNDGEYYSEVDMYAKWDDDFEDGQVYYTQLPSSAGQFEHTFSKGGTHTIELFGQFWTYEDSWGMWDEKQSMNIK